MRRVPALLALTACIACIACAGASDDAREAGQVRYEGRTLEEWWAQRRNPDDARVFEARAAMRMLGPKAVPFLAAKAAGHDLGDVIGGSVGLESMCPSAIPAMEAARARHPSPALEAAIRRVRAETDARVRAGVCTAGGGPTTRSDDPGPQR